MYYFILFFAISVGPRSLFPKDHHSFTFSSSSEVITDANDHIIVVATEINCNVIGTKIKSLLQEKMWQPQLQGSAFLVANDEAIAPNLLNYRR